MHREVHDIHQLLLLLLHPLLLGVVPLAAAQDAGSLIANAWASSNNSTVLVQLPQLSVLGPSQAGGIVVGAGRTLHVSGGEGTQSNLTWALGSATTFLDVAPGGKLIISNLTISLSSPPGPPAQLQNQSGSIQWSQVLSLPGISLQPGSSLLVLQDVVVLLPSCDSLAACQARVCATASLETEASDQLYSAPLVAPGIIAFHTLAGANSSTVAASQQHYERVQLVCSSRQGSNSSTLQLGPPASGTPMPDCLVWPVAAAADMLWAFQQIPNVVPAGSLVVLQLTHNISLESVSWPDQGVYVSNPVILQGPPGLCSAQSCAIELDLAGVPRLLVLDDAQASLNIKKLALLNLPFGPDDVFPQSLIVSAVWNVVFNRPAAQRTLLHLQDSYMVVPTDWYAYMTYWLGIQASLIPSTRQTADWMKNIVYFDMEVAFADAHRLIFTRRSGQGIKWTNSTLTDTPIFTPLTLTRTGISDIVPNNPNLPLTQVTPVQNATELLNELVSPSQAYIVVLNSIQLTDQLAATAPTVNRSATGLPLVSQPIMVLGRPGWSQQGVSVVPTTLLDFDGLSSLLAVSQQQGQRLTFSRLYLTGLGAYTPTPRGSNASSPSNTLQGNLTCLLWALDFPRGQPMVRLQNSTVVVSGGELSAVQQALMRTTSVPAAGPTIDSRTATFIRLAFSVANVITLGEDRLVLQDMATPGIFGNQVAMTSQVPVPSLATFDVTTPASVVIVAPPATGSDTPDKGLQAPILAAIVVGGVLAVLMSVLLGWLWHRRVQQLQGVVTKEQAAKAAALLQVEQLLNSSSNNSHPTPVDASRVTNPWSSTTPGETDGTVETVLRTSAAATAQASPGPGGSPGSLPHSSASARLRATPGGSGSTHQQSSAEYSGAAAFAGAPGAHGSAGTMSNHSGTIGAALRSSAGGPAAIELSQGQGQGGQDGLHNLLSGSAARSSSSQRGQYAQVLQGAASTGAGSNPSGHGGTAYEAVGAGAGADEVQVVVHGGAPQRPTTDATALGPGAGGTLGAAGILGGIQALLSHQQQQAQQGQQQPPHQAQQPLGSALPWRLVRGSHDADELTSRGVQQLGPALGPPLTGRKDTAQGDSGLSSDAAAAVALLGGSPGLGSDRQQARDVDLVDSSEGVLTTRGSGQTHTSGGSMATSQKRRLLERGLAAVAEGEPDLIVQQVVAHRKEMQAIDMQQIEFQQVLGQGSFGVVYRGKWRSITVAIKTLVFQDVGNENRVRQRAITEAAINTLLTHPNIVNTFTYELRPVAASGLPDEKHTAYWKLYIIQEYCDGGSLAQAVDKGLFMDSLTDKRNMVLILQAARDIAQGMAYIHQNNVIHGDLSSGNILLMFDPMTPSIICKVGDFGLSRFLDGPEHTHISNVRAGTPYYVAPEVVSQGSISKAADVFSFGVLLWEMYCGTPPWRDPSYANHQHAPELNPQTFPYHVPMSCPAEFHHLILSCLSEDPKARPKFVDIALYLSHLLTLLKKALAQKAGNGPQGRASTSSSQAGGQQQQDAAGVQAMVDQHTDTELPMAGDITQQPASQFAALQYQVQRQNAIAKATPPTPLHAMANPSWGGGPARGTAAEVNTASVAPGGEAGMSVASAEWAAGCMQLQPCSSVTTIATASQAFMDAPGTSRKPSDLVRGTMQGGGGGGSGRLLPAIAPVPESPCASADGSAAGLATSGLCSAVDAAPGGSAGAAEGSLQQQDYSSQQGEA